MKKKLTFLIAFAMNIAISHAQWQLTGNSILSTNFLGSTNANPLVFKANNQLSGLIDYDITRGNTSFGYQTLLSNTGAHNTAVGYAALSKNTTGVWNTATGFFALESNTTGIDNTAGSNEALSSNTTGSDNTANGFAAIAYNVDGNYNTADGSFALYHNSSGLENVAVGYQSLYTNTIGTVNTAVGYEALHSSISSGLTAVGFEALFSNTSGQDNTANGYEALFSNSTGSSNTASGHFALSTNSTGSNNTGVGFNADLNSSYSNTTVIGNGALGTASNQVRIGNSGVTSIGGYANWTNISDGRVKKNIKTNIPGLEFINKLQPISYNLDLDAADKILQRPATKDKDGNIIQSSQAEIEVRKQKEQIVYTGFIAQDVEKAAKSLNYDFSGVDAAKNSNDLYGLRYSDFVAPLVKAVQELSKTNDSLKEQVANLQSQINEIVQQISNFKLGNISSSFNGSFLKQNEPNPFNRNTIIGYTIPAKATTAVLIITDINGQILKSYGLNDRGEGQTIINGGELSAGIYFYSLVIDGNKMDTKKMILTK